MWPHIANSNAFASAPPAFLFLLPIFIVVCVSATFPLKLHECDLVWRCQYNTIQLSFIHLVSFHSISLDGVKHFFFCSPTYNTNKNSVRFSLSVYRMLDIFNCIVLFTLSHASTRFWFGLIVFWGGFLCLSPWQNCSMHRITNRYCLHFVHTQKTNRIVISKRQFSQRHFSLFLVPLVKNR